MENQICVSDGSEKSINHGHCEKPKEFIQSQPQNELTEGQEQQKSEELQNKTVLQKEQSTGECGVDLKNQELTIQVWQQRKSEKLSYQTVLSSDVDKGRWYRWLHLLTFPQ